MVRINNQAFNRYFKRSEGTACNRVEGDELEFFNAELVSFHEFKTISIYKKN